MLSKNFNNPYFSVAALAKQMNMGRGNLYRLTKSLIGLSPNIIILISRLRTSEFLLKNSDLRVNEIAEKVGLDRSVLSYAKTKAGKNEKAVDELLIDLQREKKQLEDQIEEMKAREKKLEKLIKNYESLHKDLEFKRKKIKLEEKEKSLQTAAGNNKAFEKLIREIKEDRYFFVTYPEKKYFDHVSPQLEKSVDVTKEILEVVH